MSDTSKGDHGAAASVKTPMQDQSNGSAVAAAKAESVVSKNLGVIVPAIVSLCAVLVSALQLVVGYLNSQTQAHTEQTRIENQRRVDEAKFSSQFSLDTAKFLMEHMPDIISNDSKKKAYVATVVIASFPRDHSERILKNLQAATEGATPAQSGADRNPFGDAAAFVTANGASYSTSCSAKTKLTVPVVLDRVPSLQAKKGNLEALFTAARDFGIDCQGVFEIFLAVVLQNSSGLVVTAENMSYTAQRIQAIFGVGRHGASVTPEESELLARKPQELAERVYGLGNSRKAVELGNIQAGDGFKYRGRGYLDTTGRAAYRRVGQLVGLDLEAEPDRLAEPSVAAKVAAAYFSSQLQSRATLDIATAVRVMNGGFNGLSDVRSWQDKITSGTRQATQAD